MKLKKGSAAAKAYMAKIRAKKGKKTTAKKVGAVVLNEEEKQFIREEAEERGQGYNYRAKVLFGNTILLKEKKGTPIKKWYFDFDVAKKIAEILNKKQQAKKTAKKVGNTLKLDKKEMRLGMPPKTTSKSGKDYHKDTKSHNVRISVVSGVKSKSLIGNVSNRKKIDILNFTKAEMVARLFLIVKDWSRLDDKIVLNKARALVWSRNTARENFIYPKIYEKKLTYNLLLYVMGNDNNLFSEAVK